MEKPEAIIYVKHLPAMRAFYRSIAGLEVLDQSPDYCILGSHKLIISLVLAPPQVADSIVLTDPPTPRRNVAVKLAFRVADINRLRPLIVDLGGRLDPESAAWEFREEVHCDGTDPEGNVIQLIHPAQT